MEMDTNGDIEPAIKLEKFDENPWSVNDASVFLKYCCPECDYNSESLKVFSNHALQYHERSSTLFNEKNNGVDTVPKIENDEIQDQVCREIVTYDKNHLLKVLPSSLWHIIVNFHSIQLAICQVMGIAVLTGPLYR